jgi:hypothetical protein
MKEIRSAKNDFAKTSYDTIPIKHLGIVSIKNKEEIVFKVLHYYINERRKPLDEALKSKNTTQLKKMFTEIQLLEIDAIDELITYIETNNNEPFK